LFSRKVERIFFAWPPTFGVESWRSSKTILWSASYGAVKHEPWELHEKENKIVFAQPPTFGAESWKLSKEIL
jgi:hypothetical protein